MWILANEFRDGIRFLDLGMLKDPHLVAIVANMAVEERIPAFVQCGGVAGPRAIGKIFTPEI